MHRNIQKTILQHYMNLKIEGVILKSIYVNKNVL